MLYEDSINKLSDEENKRAAIMQSVSDDLRREYRLQERFYDVMKIINKLNYLYEELLKNTFNKKI